MSDLRGNILVLKTGGRSEMNRNPKPSASLDFLASQRILVDISIDHGKKNFVDFFLLQ